MIPTMFYKSFRSNVILACAAGLLASSAVAQPRNQPETQYTDGPGRAAVKRGSAEMNQKPSASHQQNQESAATNSQKLTILEFGDMQCPDTAAFASGSRQQVLNDFVRTGQATYAFHDFPLDAHPLAPIAAAAARCAGPKTEAVRQALLSGQSGIRSESDVIAAAAQAGIDSGELQRCMASGSSMAAVQKDRDLGRSYGVRATPSLVLGYGTGADFKPVKVIRGDRPYAQVRQDIQALVVQASTAARR